MSELRDRVETVIRNEIAPLMELDGSSIEVLDVEQGCARVRLNGACAGCPATIMTLVMGMESELRKRIPEVEYLEATP
jgi:Fe-S cluster biogenesis protein NfuA